MHQEYQEHNEFSKPKRQWQTPELQEVDYKITSGMSSGSADGGSGHGS
jgi:hypothetical protein